jgi:hypothetical protein
MKTCILVITPGWSARSGRGCVRRPSLHTIGRARKAKGFLCDTG